MATHDSIQAVIQNLKDAGCDDNMVERFLALQQEGNTAQQMKLLACHRCKLLARVHREEEKIQCLDFLLYQMEKKKRNL